MTKKIETSEPEVGCPPAGLFESDDGNKYIIAFEDGRAIAITLAHRTIPPFTCLDLREQAPQRGRWWGPYRLRLIHALPGSSRPRTTGTIGLFAGSVILDCRSVHDDLISRTLGYFPEDDGHDRDYDGWIVEAVEGERLFFERSHKRKGSLILDVQAAAAELRSPS